MTDQKEGFDKFKVSTTIDGSKITQVSTLLMGRQIVAQLSHKIVDTEEDGIKLALVELGWTPPKDNIINQTGVEK